ncbi:MAG TPA: bifunctional DNA-formamidopyrimidine glycosylase/DNA-(apurinic or apyrimidinic site) lyase [Gemmatimonadaceae bacterium]|nr:bifunctional DNA-formamidopyrimidine glycosylase/DNA-(apurinic or apyrimidinic site) lyase [Gemmatimonadaceae bacterium]
MPELPEVETIARDLEDAVRGATIAAVHVHRRDVLRECSAAALAKRLTGAVLARFRRRAKYVIAELSSGDRLVVSPRFTGALLVEPAPFRVDRSDYTAIQFALTDGRTLRYRDVRRLGTVALMSPRRFDEWQAAIGPEPLDPALTPDRFSGIVRASSRAIKTILMDQRRVAGIGNIYANESLWRARIRPTRRGTSLTRAEAATLLAEARAVLAAAVAQRGTSFRDYRDPYGGRGGFLALAKVYGRAGEPCARCGATLRATHKLERRITVWCATCQR